MFYEDEKDILKRMKEQVPDDIDKRDNSSLLYNSLSPAAQESSKIRSDMDRALSYAFASPNIPDEYLDLICIGNGITRKPATYAIKVGTFANEKNNLIDIPLKSRFSIDKLIYVAIEKIEVGKYKMQCETIGTEGNTPIGELLPVEYIENLGSAKLSELIYEAIDQEDNQSLYDRLIIKIQTPATSGNKYHYLNWAMEVSGVGYAKCIPGAGNVKVIIANSNKRAASEELIRQVHEYIDSVRPILAGTLTVVTVKEIAINVTANVEIDSSVILGDVQELFKTTIENYFTNTVYTTKKISMAKLGALLMDIEGVVDYSNLKINGGTSNVSLGEDEIAVVGTVTLGG